MGNTTWVSPRTPRAARCSRRCCPRSGERVRGDEGRRRALPDLSSARAGAVWRRVLFDRRRTLVTQHTHRDALRSTATAGGRDPSGAPGPGRARDLSSAFRRRPRLPVRPCRRRRRRPSRSSHQSPHDRRSLKPALSPVQQDPPLAGLPPGPAWRRKRSSDAPAPTGRDRHRPPSLQATHCNTRPWSGTSPCPTDVRRWRGGRRDDSATKAP